jgi:hypothetical protein
VRELEDFEAFCRFCLRKRQRRCGDAMADVFLDFRNALPLAIVVWFLSAALTNSATPAILLKLHPEVY